MTKFKVTRASASFLEDKKPCKEAFEEKYTRVEVRTFGSFEEFDSRFGEREGNWLSKGVNHCINKDNHIQREFPDGAEGWFVEINTLEDLLRFQEKYGDIVLTKVWENSDILKLIIYDDYLE